MNCGKSGNDTKVRHDPDRVCIHSHHNSPENGLTHGETRCKKQQRQWKTNSVLVKQKLSRNHTRTRSGSSGEANHNPHHNPQAPGLGALGSGMDKADSTQASSMFLYLGGARFQKSNHNWPFGRNVENTHMQTMHMLSTTARVFVHSSSIPAATLVSRSSFRCRCFLSSSASDWTVRISHCSFWKTCQYLGSHHSRTLRRTLSSTQRCTSTLYNFARLAKTVLVVLTFAHLLHINEPKARNSGSQ